MIRFWRRSHPDLVPRWKAFIESPAAEGEPTIAPAKVPAVRTLKAQRVPSILERFRKHGR